MEKAFEEEEEEEMLKGYYYGTFFVTAIDRFYRHGWRKNCIAIYIYVHIF